MKTDDLHDNPYWQITLLSSRIKHDVANVAESHGLTPSQMQTLLLVEPRTQTPMNRLSCMISCDASYITGIVDKLTSLGYIERKENSFDRRIKTIELTKEGVTFRQKLIRDFNNFHTSTSELKSIEPTIVSSLATLVDLTAKRP